MRRKRENPFSLFSFQDIITGVSGIMIFFVLVMLVDLVSRREGGYEPQPSLAVVDFSQLEFEISRLESELATLRDQTKLKIVSIDSGAAPEVAAKLQAEMSQKELEIVALVSQVEALRAKMVEADKVVSEKRKIVERNEQARRSLATRLENLKNKKGITLIPGRGESKTPVFVILGRGGYEVLKPLSKTTYRKWYNYGQLEKCIENELKVLDTDDYTVVIMVRPSGLEKMESFANIVERLGFTYGRDPLEEELDVDLGKAEGAM